MPVRPCCFRRGSRAQAGRFPVRPVRIIVPYPPGGVSDTTARLLAERLTPVWGQSVTVENRAGANGMIGATAAARAEPGGTTLRLAGTAHSISTALSCTPYDTVLDLTYITTTSQTPQALIAAPNFPPVTAILKRADIVERNANLGTTIWTMSAEEATCFMGAEIAKWEETARGIGIERGTRAQ